MNKKLPSAYSISTEVGRALAAGAPIVALETTVVTHGLPEPENRELARNMEVCVRDNGAIPATIGVLDGRIHVGMSEAQLDALATAKPLHKISSRDFATVIARKESGGTTVAGTLIAAQSVRIRVFATGGIGGVHRDAPFDVSTDLQALSRTPVIVVCSGAKSILDLPATLEVLETYGVPVVGYKTDEFPAFYARSSGLPVSVQAENPKEVVKIAKSHWQLGLNSAILVVQPPPKDSALSGSEMESAVDKALIEARRRKMRGQDVTPFLLSRVSELTGRASLQTNLALLLNNSRTAARISVEFFRGQGKLSA